MAQNVPVTRPPCSEHEVDAAGSLAARLGAAGYAVAVERFGARPSPEPWLAAYAGFSAVAALLVYPLPLGAALVGMAALVLHARESDGRPLVRRPSCTSANVVARSRAAESPDLVVIASLSTHRGRFGEARTRSLGLSIQVLMVAVAAGGAAVWIAEAEGEIPGAIGTAGIVVALGIAALVLTLHRPPEADALEADPAVDVLVDLAPRLRDRRVWLVGVGSGSDAIRSLVESHASELAGAAWLNLEPAAGDQVVAVSEEGTWRERRADRALMGAAEEAGAEVRPYRAAPTNVTPLLARRRRALTLLVPAATEAHPVVLATALAAFERPDSP